MESGTKKFEKFQKLSTHTNVVREIVGLKFTIKAQEIH